MSVDVDEAVDRCRDDDGSLAWYVHSPVLDADRVNAHLLGDKLDAVVGTSEILNVARLGVARGTGDGGLHVVPVGT